MYVFIDRSVTDIYNKECMAKIIGVHPNTLRDILNKKKPCSKVIAYSITKFLDSNASIEKYFKEIDRGE